MTLGVSGTAPGRPLATELRRLRGAVDDGVRHRLIEAGPPVSSGAVSSPGRPRSLLPALLRWGPLGIASVVLVWHSLQYDFVTDDAYISFVFSRNLAEHGELSFNPGDPVEGYTNFLWTFVLGILMLVGIPPEVSSKVLGTAFGLGGLWMSFRITERLLGRGHVLAGLPPLLLAWSSGYACWSSGGLETQLYTFLVAAALDAYLGADEAPRRLRRMGALLALASMTRPEGPMLVAIIGAHRLVVNLVRERRLRPSRDEWMAAAWFLGLWAPWFAWRWWYYGSPFPNTYYVKAAGEAVRGYDAKMRAHGGHYVHRWFEQTGLLWGSVEVLPRHLSKLGVGAWLAVLGLIANPRGPRFRAAVLFAALAGFYLLYAVSVGGDFMGLHRFIMPVFVIAAVLLALGVDNLTWPLREVAWRPVRAIVAGVAAVALLAGFAARQVALTERSLKFGNFTNDNGIDTPAFLRVYAHDRTLIGERLRPCVGPDDFAIFGGVGALPYAARLRGIDVFGLVSWSIAHLVPRSNARAGHNKWGDDPRLLTSRFDPLIAPFAADPRLLPDAPARYPTLVMHCYALRPTPGVAPLGCAGFWEARGYERVVLHVPGLLERGEYYTFLARKDRRLECPGLGR